MKPSNLILIAGLLICCLICAAVPAVSAETFSDHYAESEYSRTELTYSPSGSGTSGTSSQLYLYFPDTSTNYENAFFLTYIGSNIRITKNGSYGDYRNIPVTIAGYSATLSYDETENFLGQYVKSYIGIYFDNPENVESLSGYQLISFSSEYSPSISLPGMFSGYIDQNIDLHGSIQHRVYFAAYNYGYYFGASDTQCITNYNWESDISGSYLGDLPSSITLSRYQVQTNFTLRNRAGEILYTDYSDQDIDYDFFESEYSYNLTSPKGRIYTQSFYNPEPEEDTISVLASVLSTADDALIGGATLNFNSTVQNVSQTLTSGYGLYTLYPGVEYTVSASAENYQEELSTNPTITFGGDSRYDYYLKPVYGVENGTVQLNFYVTTANTAGSGYIKVPQAVITLNSASTLITNDAGYAYAVLNRSGSISYTITKDGYKTYSRSFTPNWETWSSDTFEEYVTMLKEGTAIGDVTPEPTPDTRSNVEKAESAFDIIFNNIEMFATMASLALFFAFVGWMTPHRGSRRLRR